MPHGNFTPAQNFNKPIGARTKPKKTHRSGGPSSNSGRSGVKTNHGAGIPQRKVL